MRFLTPEDFQPWVGKKVRVNTLPEPVEVTLDRIQVHAPLVGIDTRQPFSLFFSAPLAVYLLDMEYEFDCGRGGPHGICIQQLFPSATHRHYQAVFS